MTDLDIINIIKRELNEYEENILRCWELHMYDFGKELKIKRDTLYCLLAEIESEIFKELEGMRKCSKNTTPQND